ncbi:MAG: hypothetical protein ACHQFW_10370, partial [Chitinophagales bacterium]
MKKLILPLFLTAFCQLPAANCFSQAPEIENEKLFCDGDYDVSFVLTPDDGAVVATSSYTGICNEKNETGQGGLDYWIFKIDAEGTILWQNVIGGSGDDRATSIKSTGDGGYIIAGTSNSAISGDKTEPNHDFLSPYHTDMWIIKLDATGNIIWQNTIGGNENENSPYIEQTTTGGYILSCNSYSPISGDKMEGVIGGTGNSDYWILKLNSAGNIVWQNTIGGNDDDYIRTVHQTDGGYICAGYSSSGISGDKTEGIIASTDYWIIKLNNSGNIIWQNTIGSLAFDYAVDIILEPDGTFTLGGYTAGYYTPKFQITRLNSGGSVIWDNAFPSGYESWLRSISKTMDGGYIFGGTTNGDGPPCNAYGWECWNLWVIKTDATGNVEWDTGMGSGDDDGPAFVRQTSDGGYLISGNVGIDEEGDISDKSSLYAGAWLVKLNDSVCVPATEICNALDDNCNGIIDEGIVDEIIVSADGPTAFCSGGSVILSADYYTGTTLQWKKNGEDIPGATSATYTATAKGTYTCETTSDCTFAISEWIVVDVFKKPNANVTPGGATTFCAGGSVTLTETPTGGCTYQWYKNGLPITGATSTTYVATTAGSYKCLVTKTVSGCSKQSNSIVVSVPCKEGDPKELNNPLSIYPN